MEVEVCRHALDRVPLSLIIDDSTALVNLNYFFIRDANAYRGEQRRWQDVPVVTPESFTRDGAPADSPKTDGGSKAGNPYPPAQQPDDVDQLIRRLKGQDLADRMHAARALAKLGPKAITTVRGVGYRFDAR